MSDVAKKVETLMEAMPYLEKYQGKVIVIKYGGNAMINDELKDAVLHDVVMLKLLGLKPVLSHGGGPGINKMLEKLNIPVQFINGLRYTSEDIMRVVEMVLVGQVNTELVGRINQIGGKAVGLSGVSGDIYHCHKRSEELGFVGDIDYVNADAINAMLDAGFIPVIAPVGTDGQGNTYNINGDTAAGKLASALGAEKLVILNSPVMQFCVYTSMILISFFAAKLIVTSGGTYLGVGSLTSMITYSMQILMSLMMLSMIFVMLTMAQASGKRICEVLGETSSLHNPENPVYEVPNGAVDFDHVEFKYSASAKRSALSDIDFHVKSGQTVGIIGGTGSAKTTLVQLICRLYDVTDGSVKVGWRDVRAYDLETLRNQVAVVLQKNVLFSGTIRENLRWGDPNATDAELQRACELACADEFIQQMPDKYDTYIEQGGSNVSGGQKQRLCIARALLKKPKILILDDSTSAVDTKTDAKIRAALRTEIPETTKFIIAQRISSIQDADLILVLDGGAINGMGTHETLLSSNQIYQEVYYSQNRTGGVDNG